MFSVFLIGTMLFFALCICAVLALVGSVFRVAFSIVWWPLKIVGVLVATVVFLGVGLPVLAVALPIILIVGIIGIPLLIIGGLFFGGLSLVGFA